jgi:hypothetical protein
VAASSEQKTAQVKDDCMIKTARTGAKKVFAERDLDRNFLPSLACWLLQLAISKVRPLNGSLGCLRMERQTEKTTNWRRGEEANGIFMLRLFANRQIQNEWLTLRNAEVLHSIPSDTGK